MENFNLEKAVEILREWASSNPVILRIFIFGSRIKGSNQPMSDLDIGIELDPTQCNPFVRYIHEGDEWERELQSKIPWPIQLEWYDPKGSTPTIEKGKSECSELIYERNKTID